MTCSSSECATSSRLQGFEKFVGSKTSIRWQNARYSGFRENPEEALLGWCATTHRVPSHISISSRDRSNHVGISNTVLHGRVNVGYVACPHVVLASVNRYCKPFRSFDAQPTKSPFRYDCSDIKQRWPRILTIMLAKKIHPLNQDFDKWMLVVSYSMCIGVFTHDGLFAPVETSLTCDPFLWCRENHASPSSGLRGLTILLHVCKHVDVYGMGGSTDFRAWYWDKYPGLEVRKGLHTCFRVWAPHGPIPDVHSLIHQTIRFLDDLNPFTEGKPKDKDQLEKLFPRLGDKEWQVDAWNSVPRSTSTKSGRKLLDQNDNATTGPYYLRRSLLGKQEEDGVTKDPAHMHRGLEDRCLGDLVKAKLVTLRQ
eukprot:1187236-Prorocentrum_minimum.AAC.3